PVAPFPRAPEPGGPSHRALSELERMLLDLGQEQAQIPAQLFADVVAHKRAQAIEALPARQHAPELPARERSQRDAELVLPAPHVLAQRGRGTEQPDRAGLA